MKKKIKVLAWSDSPMATTGFGRVAREVLKSVYATGKYDITSIGINYNGMTPELPKTPSQSDKDIVDAYRDYRTIPAKVLNTRMGEDVLLEMLEKDDFDVVWMMQDHFLIAPFAKQLADLKAKKKFKVIMHFPVDSKYTYKEYFFASRVADKLVVCNEWTAKLIKQALGEEIEGRMQVIPYGYNPLDFYPISDTEKDVFRKELFGVRVEKDDILIMRSDSNQQRKDWNKTLQIVAAVAKKNPKVKFYANTEVTKPYFPLFALAQTYGMVPGTNFLYNHHFRKVRNFSQDILNKLYNITDIGISTSRGEGCGLFHYEMMALGKPLVISANTAHLEAIEAGAAAGILSGEDEKRNVNPSLVDLMDYDCGILRDVCDVEHGVKVLTDMVSAIQNQRKRDQIAERASKFMADKTWEQVGQKWVELFETISNVLPSDVFMFGAQETGKKTEATQSDKITEFSQNLKKAIDVARHAFKVKYGEEPPEINYFGSEDGQPKKL